MREVILYDNKLFSNANNLIEYLGIGIDNLNYFRVRITRRRNNIKGYRVEYVKISENVYNVLKTKPYIPYDLVKLLHEAVVLDVLKEL